MSPLPLEFSVTEGPQRLDLFLSRQTSRSRAFIQHHIRSSLVNCNGVIVTKPSHTVGPGVLVLVQWTQESESHLKPVPHRLDILFEDKDLLIINKPQGLVVHPGAGHRGETLVHYLLHHLQNETQFLETSPTRPGIVHRLDRGTSGALLIAKRREILESLSAQFKSREVSKVYEAIVWGTLQKEGRITSEIGRDRVNRKKMSSNTVKGREAVTRWKVEESFNHFSLVMLFPKTGRTHQLRVHLTDSKCPIVGDALYGRGLTPRRRKELSPTILNFLEGVKHPFLHARRLEFLHPTTQKPLAVEAGRPQIFEEFLQLIRQA